MMELLKTRTQGCEEMDKRFDTWGSCIDRIDKKIEDTEEENKNNQCPAGLELQTQQPHLAVKADIFQDKKTRESKQGLEPDG